MPQEQPQASDRASINPPKTVERNPFRSAEFLQTLAAPPSHATNPFLVATPNETAQTTAPEPPTARPLNDDWTPIDNGPVNHHEYGSVVNIERNADGAHIRSLLGHVTQIEEFNVLRSLPIHPDINSYLSDCFPDSRTEDEARILQWIDSDHLPELVLCVLGKVGVGKSTLAKPLATRLGDDKRLAGNIFLGFALPDWTPELVVRMVAGQLCGAFPALTRAIRLDVNPSVSLEIRIQKLILEPIQSLGLPQPLVILLDALDQWAPHPTLIKALACLTTKTHLVRFVVLGRPGLEDRFLNVSFRRYDLLDVVEGVMGEYFKERLKQVQWEYGRKPSLQTINQLVNKASGLFIWSSTLCSVLEDELSCPNPHETVTALLHSQQSIGDNDILANLYHSAIHLRFPKPDHKAKLKVLLGALLVLQAPLPIAAFASLVSMPVPTIRKILSDLRPLQTGQMKDDLHMVDPAPLRFHLSFLEYLQSTDTPPHLAFPIDASTSHCQLGKACLEELHRLLSSPPSTFTTPLQKYATKNWPTHTAYGTPTVSPASDAEWKATPHSAILDGLSILQWHRWGISYLQLARPGTPLDRIDPDFDASGTPTQDGSQYFISCLVRLQHEPPVVADTTDAIALGEVAVRLHHQNAEAWLALGRAYEHTSQTNASINLLDSAVRACRCAAEIQGEEGHIFQVVLAKCLGQRFVRFGAREDLDEAISLERAVMLATSLRHPDRGTFLNNLALSLQSHYKQTGVAESLDEAIVLLREALLLRPLGHPYHTLASSNLANALQAHFEQTGAAESLNEATTLLRETLSLLPLGHSLRAISLNNLANSLCSQFEQTGAIESLNEAIILNREALSLWPPGHHNRTLSLNNLASTLCTEFEQTYAAESIEEAILLYREALSLRPPGHLDHALSLNNLATALQTDFKLTNAAESLEEAIVLLREALFLRPSGHPYRALSLHNLACALQSHFEHTGTTESLDEAIALNREALSLRPPGHHHRTLFLNSLVSTLQASYRLTGNIETLEEAQSLLPLSTEATQ